MRGGAEISGAEIKQRGYTRSGDVGTPLCFIPNESELGGTRSSEGAKRGHRRGAVTKLAEAPKSQVASGGVGWDRLTILSFERIDYELKQSRGDTLFKRVC